MIAKEKPFVPDTFSRPSSAVHGMNLKIRASVVKPRKKLLRIADSTTSRIL
jgi:hypothetical protein